MAIQAKLEVAARIDAADLATPASIDAGCGVIEAAVTRQERVFAVNSRKR